MNWKKELKINLKILYGCLLFSMGIGMIFTKIMSLFPINPITPIISGCILIIIGAIIIFRGKK